MKKTLIPTKDRPATMISLRVPVDVVEKLKKIAPAKGMSGYQALIKYYVGKGLREDFDLVRQVESVERLESTLARLGLKGDQINEIWDALRGYIPSKPKPGREDESSATSAQ
jgi:hypothetical protein